MSGVLHASQEQVIAFRLRNQNLLERLPAGLMLEAAGACGIQDTPPGSAALGLQARVEKLSPAEVERALAEDKSLLQVWSMRISPYMFPTADLPVFSSGLLPENEDEWQFCLKTISPILAKAGVSATEAMQLTVAAMQEVLDGQTLAKGEFSSAVSKHIPENLLYWCKACDAWHVGESQFRLAQWFGSICFVPGESKQNYFGLTGQWLEKALPKLEPQAAQTELVRRYLHCYGPSTAAHFAEWAGVSPAQGRRVWKLIEPELVEVNYNGKKTWLLESDVSGFETPQEVSGVRLLPPYDVYLQLRDRETIVPDKIWQKQVWTTLGNPGVVLVDGELAGTWRPQKKGKKLLLKIELFHPISPAAHPLIEQEAELIAPFKGCTSVEVTGLS